MNKLIGAFLILLSLLGLFFWAFNFEYLKTWHELMNVTKFYGLNTVIIIGLISGAFAFGITLLQRVFRQLDFEVKQTLQLNHWKEK
jgi:hypothetical protein